MLRLGVAGLSAQDPKIEVFRLGKLSTLVETYRLFYKFGRSGHGRSKILMLIEGQARPMRPLFMRSRLPYRRACCSHLVALARDVRGMVIYLAKIKRKELGLRPEKAAARVTAFYPVAL